MKSPFIIEQDFLSPYLTEDLVDAINIITPDVDKHGVPISSFKYNDDLELVVFDNIKSILSKFEEYYGVKYKGTDDMKFEYLPNGCNGKTKTSDNSVYINGKWSRTKNNDFTGIIFLCDYNDKAPFAEEFEVFGAKLEFSQHNFGFNPERGTLILFPSDPHFLYGFSRVQLGDGYFIKFNITCEEQFVYNRLNFPGNYLTWFNSIV